MIFFVHFSFFWGYIGDKKGKKFALVVACIGVSIVSLAFGFSDSFWWAFCTRFLQGAFGKSFTKILSYCSFRLNKKTMYGWNLYI